MTDKINRYTIDSQGISRLVHDGWSAPYQEEWVKYYDYIAVRDALKYQAREAVLQSLASLGQAEEAYAAQLEAESQRDSFKDEAVILRSILRSALEHVDPDNKPDWAIRAEVAIKRAEE